MDNSRLNNRAGNDRIHPARLGKWGPNKKTLSPYGHGSPMGSLGLHGNPWAPHGPLGVVVVGHVVDVFRRVLVVFKKRFDDCLWRVCECGVFHLTKESIKKR